MRPIHKTQTAWPRFHSPTWYQHALGPDCAGPPLVGHFDTGTLVVGAGLAGLSTALGLAERAVTDVMVVDRGQPGEGASGRNGGFVFGGYSLDNRALADQVGRQRARRLHAWTRQAVALIRRRCDDLGVAVSDQGVLLADWFDKPERLRKFQRELSELIDFQLEWVGPQRMSEWVRSRRYGAGLLEPGSFHFNPLAYARAIANRLNDEGVRVAGGSPLISLQREGSRWVAQAAGATIKADRVVLATGGYDRNLRRRVQRAVQPIATYIMVTETLGDRLKTLIPGGVAVYDTRFAFDYYRPLPDNRLLWGGRISIADRNPGAIGRLLKRDLEKVFPELNDVRIDFSWGGWMSYARHQMPILGEIEPDLWSALAFGGHGMAITTLAGEVLAEAITGDRARLAEFAPWGPVWAGGPVGRAAVQGVYWWKQLRDRIMA